jgi:AraC family transcriptional regulator
MFLRFETIRTKQLLGMHLTLSFTKFNVEELWKKFMPLKKTIGNIKGQELYSLEVYLPGFFISFNPNAFFEKWAAVEVTDYDQVPAPMEPFELTGGLYAVFMHKGPSSTASATYNYIFREWLPASGYVPDDRPHFAVMKEHYRRDDPGSEEEVWIPVRPRKER